MSLPSKKIKKIKLPGDVEGSQTYEIIPEKLGKDGYAAELPTLTKDETIETQSHASSTYQTKLSTQTAYSAKGSATKVPQITTNSLGQVTGITEVTITDNNDNQKVKAKNNGTDVTFGANDIVEIKAGANVQVAANAADKTITISSTNTTYTVASGDGDGQIKVTPSSGGAYNVSVNGLGDAAYKSTGIASGNVPVLDNNGKLDASILPAIAVSESFTADSQSAMLALTAQVGDICFRTDEEKTYILVKTPASTLNNWKLLEHPADAVTGVKGSAETNYRTGNVSLSYGNVGAASSTHKHSYTPAGTVSLGSNDTASGGVAYIASVSGTAAEGTKTTKYLHKTTTNVSPNAHTHTVIVSGTTGTNSGTAVKAATAVGADGTADVNYNAIKAVSLSASATSTDGPAYVQSVTHTAASLTGTKTFNTNAIKSVSLSASETSTDGPKYVEDVSHTAASLTGTKTFNTDAIKSVTLSASETSTDGPAYIQSVTHTAATLTGTKTFNTDAIKSVALSASDTSTDGPAYISSVTGGSAVTKTTKYMKFDAGTTPAASASFTGSAVTSGNNSGTKVVALTAINGGSGSLESYDAATSGTKKVSDGTRIPYVAAQGTITGASYTPAGTVTLTAGTAPSMGAATTKYLSAAPSHTSTASGNNSGTKVVAVTGYPNFSGGSLTGTKTFVTGVSGGSGKLESYDAATSGAKKVSDGTRIGYISSLNTTKLSASFTGSAVTSAANSGTKVTAVTGYPNFSGGSLGGTKTFVTGVSGGSGSLESNTTASGGIKYLEAVSFENGILTLETKYLHHTHTAASASGTGTVTLTAASLGSPSTGDCAPNAHTHSVTAAGSVSLSTGDSGTTIATGGTTWYLAHSHTGASSSGTGTVGFTAASLGDPSTGDAAPHTHTHNYDKTTGITLTANAETATGRIQYVQAQGTFSAGTTPKASASFSGTPATITPTLSAPTIYYLAHSHTGASAKTTGDAAPHTHTHSVTAAGTVSLTAGTAPSMNFDTGESADHQYIYDVSGGSAVTATKKYMKATTTAASTGTVGISGGSITPVTRYMKATTAAASTGTVGISGGSISKTIKYMKATTTAADTGTVGISGGSIDATTKYMKVGTTAADTVAVLTGVKVTGTADAAPAGHTHSYGSATALTTSANSGSAVAAITSLTANEQEATGDIKYLEDYAVSGGTVSGTTKYFHPSFSGTTKDTGEPK